MSTYYNINGLKVRVSDHEPNTSMDKFRGRNDVEFYTVDATGKRLSVAAQVEHYCDKHGVDIALFGKVLADFADEEVNVAVTQASNVEVSAELVNAFKAITGKGSYAKRKEFCAAHGLDFYTMDQAKYTII